MFIQTEQTPNPETLKFLPGKVILDTGKTIEFKAPEAAQHVPLAQQLFRIQGVKSVFFGHDFISITKTAECSWSVLNPSVLRCIMEYFITHSRVEIPENPVSSASHSLDASFQDTQEDALDDPITHQIKALLETRIRPAVAQDGGDIVFRKFEDGVVYLQMQGACSGCPSSSATLKSGIENMLKHYIPEVQEVRPA